MKPNKSIEQKPDRYCVTCGTKLMKDEYELCAECEAELGVPHDQDKGKPQKPQDWN